MVDPDDLVRRGFEQLSNTTTRYRFLEKAAKGIVATLTVLTVGGLTAQTVLANVGGCCSSTAKQCPNCPNVGGHPNCPPNGTSGHNWSTCTGSTSNPTCKYCDYGGGYWTCAFGSSFVYCNDCWIGDCSNPSLPNPCTCASSV